ncbi:MAG: sodium:proton exchanger [Desulfuromonas sp.]|mgnify:CR=1 FL=1|nr:MAG: sodium:proton exchanger [Desulfuromonas sp.]
MLEPILVIGLILFGGFLTGELCMRFGLPKVTGYILAGLLLNPRLTPVIPVDFVDHTDLVTNISLAFITFSVGGTLLMSRIRKLGKPIILITLLEAEGAFLFVAASFVLIAPWLLGEHSAITATQFVPLALLLGSLAAPTDPSATLAVVHEYHASGEVTSTVMGVAAFDDILGIINYSLAVGFAAMFVLHQPLQGQALLQPLVKIGGSLVIGVLFGVILNRLIHLIRREKEGVLITLVFSLLALCYGVAGTLHSDELLSTMTMGVVVTNFNPHRDEIFQILERYTEELVFVLFFTLSAMHLDFTVLVANLPIIGVFVLFRALGKWCGSLLGGSLAHSSPAVRRFTVGGLLPQGGIVIGLALLIRQNPDFAGLSEILVNVIIGATVVHEIVGPVVSKAALKMAGELPSSS